MLGMALHTVWLSKYITVCLIVCLTSELCGQLLPLPGWMLTQSSGKLCICVCVLTQVLCPIIVVCVDTWWMHRVVVGALCVCPLASSIPRVYACNKASCSPCRMQLLRLRWRKGPICCTYPRAAMGLLYAVCEASLTQDITHCSNGRHAEPCLVAHWLVHVYCLPL